MYDDFLLNNNSDAKISSSSESLTDLDSLFNNLSDDINNFNKYIATVNKKKNENLLEEKELIEEKIRLDKAKMDFENYVKAKNEEYEKKMQQVDEYLNSQKQNLLKTESEFKSNMENSLNELELTKKEILMEKEKFKEEKEQFETYKSLELNRIKHSQDILESEKNQFEKYKEVNMKKIELENKSLEQKCDKFKELFSQFNSNFRPIVEEE